MSGNEDAVQAAIRLGAAKLGMTLMRNNVGALRDKTGRLIRYGLANDSEAVNERNKSSDLIGWRSVTITPEMVGQKVAIFVARECKRPGWRYTGTEEEQAQLRFLELINSAGGDACFVASVDGIVNPAYELRYGR